MSSVCGRWGPKWYLSILGRVLSKMRSTLASRDWVTNVRTTYLLLGSVVGAHPYPMIVRDFQSVIGDEAESAEF